MLMMLIMLKIFSRVSFTLSVKLILTKLRLLILTD